MNLGEFKEELRAAHKRGDSLDDRLVGFVRRAARFIEQNWTLQYMRRRFTLAIAAGVDEVALPPGVPVKTIEKLKVVQGATSYACNKVDLGEFEVPLDGVPRQFYLNGTTHLVFNGPFASGASAFGILARYSDWPKENDETHWLLDNAEGLLLRQTLIEILTDSRDERGLTAMLAKREEDIRVLLAADYEARYTGQDIFLS